MLKHNLFRGVPEETQIRDCNALLLSFIKKMENRAEKTKCLHALENLVRLARLATTRNPYRRCRHCHR